MCHNKSDQPLKHSQDCPLYTGYGASSLLSLLFSSLVYCYLCSSTNQQSCTSQSKLCILNNQRTQPTDQHDTSSKTDCLSTNLEVREVFSQFISIVLFPEQLLAMLQSFCCSFSLASTQQAHCQHVPHIGHAVIFLYQAVQNLHQAACIKELPQFWSAILRFGAKSQIHGEQSAPLLRLHAIWWCTMSMDRRNHNKAPDTAAYGQASIKRGAITISVAAGLIANTALFIIGTCTFENVVGTNE